MLSRWSLAALVGIGAATLTSAQSSQSGSATYSHNAPEFKVDTSNAPADVQEGYRLFRAKCGECHSPNRLLTKTNLSPDEWADIVFRMQDMASSHTSEGQSKAILNFVIWNDQRAKRKGQQNENR